MVLVFLLPALPLALVVGTVCMPDHLERITSDHRARLVFEQQQRQLRRRLALERAARYDEEDGAVLAAAHA